MENSRALTDCRTRTEQRQLRKKMHRARVMTMAAATAALAVMAAVEVSYLKSGVIEINSSEYTVFSGEEENRAVVAEALSMAKDNSDMMINIEVPETCPVNMTAFSPIAIVYDKTDECVLYAKNETEKCYPASTAKLMTAAVTLDLAPKGYSFIAGNELDLLPEGASLARINKCYSLDTEQLIDGIILKGGSDVSYTAAANVGRLMSDTDDISSEESLKKFVDMMNNTARNIGADSTHFTNPDGQFSENNYTTAKDMVRIAVYASEHEEIMRSASKEKTNGKLASGQVYDWVNTNKLVLSESNDYYEYATGLKTGMTDGTGYCIAASAVRDGHELICIVMNSDSDEHRMSDVKNLFDLSFEYLGSHSEEE